MKKKIIVICALVLALVLALFALSACNNDESGIGEELVSNGDFSSWDSTNKKFDEWATSTSSVTFGYGHHSDEEDNYYLYIKNTNKAYSYLNQTIPVESGKVYKVTVDVRVNNLDTTAQKDFAAYVTFLENTGYKFAVQNGSTNGSYKTFTFYVCPKGTDYLNLALCLGTKELGSTGTVLFDNVSMQKIAKSNVPSGSSIVTIRKFKNVTTVSNGAGIAFVVVLTVASAAILVLAYILLRRLYAKRDVYANLNAGAVVPQNKKVKVKNSGVWYKHPAFIASMLALGGFVLRLILLLTTFGIGKSTFNVIELAKYLGQNGAVAGYFEKYATSTIPAGQLYLLSILGAMGANLGAASFSILMRFVNVLADMAVIVMIYLYGRKYVGDKLSTLYAGLYAVIPFVFVMSGINTTFDSILVALLLGTIILMVEKQYLPTYLMITLAAVFDIRALAIAPIIVAYFVYRYYKDDKNVKKFTANRAMIVFGLVGSFVLAYLLTLPVGIHQIAAGDAFFNFKTMVQQITGTKYFVSNAFNLYGMVAMNSKTITQTGVSILNLVFLLVLEIYVITLYFKNRNKQELILLAAFTLAVISVFTLKIDYTYLFLSIALALVYTMISGDKRMYIVTAGYSVLGFLNIGQLLSQSQLIAQNAQTLNLINYETTNPFYIFFCVVTVLLTGYYVYVVYSITNNTKIVDIKPLSEPLHKVIKKKFAKKQRVAE